MSGILGSLNNKNKSLNSSLNCDISNNDYKEAPICFINKTNLDDPYIDYFKHLNNQRRDKTFPTFVRNTNEKNQTIKISSAFLDDYLPKLIHHCQVLDLGLGEGDLSTKVANYMQGKCENIRYEGIDRSEKFVETAKQKLITVGIKDNNIILGDCFGGDIDRLVSHPTVLIASQIIFYAKDINDFVDRIVKKMGAIAIIIGQSDFSFLNHVNKAYALSSKQSNTESKVDTALTSYETISNVKILYNSIINFPAGVSIEKVAFSEFDSLIDPKEKEAREILEFVAGSPLEYLEYKGNLLCFIQDIKKHLKLNSNVIGFWNFMSIAAPSNQLSKNELQAKWQSIQKQKFSQELNQFESALNEGNIDIVSSILNQGLVTCALHDEGQGMALSMAETLHSYAVYSLSFPPIDYNSYLNSYLYYLFPPLEYILWPFDYISSSLDFIRLIVKEWLGEGSYLDIKYRKYINKNAEKLHYHKYNYEATQLRTNKPQVNWDNEVIAKGQKYSEYTSESFQFHGMFYAAVCATWILPKLGKNPIALSMYHYKIALGISSMFFYVDYKFFGVGNYAIHAIRNVKTLALYLSDRENIKTINFQNCDGQTVLHLAFIKNDIEKAAYLLKCKSTVVNSPDVYGKLPIHYALEYDNREIIKILCERNDIDVQVYNLRKIIFDCGLFLGKLLFLHAYFADNICYMKSVKDVAINLLLSSIYGYARMHEIRFPDNIYMHMSLLQRDPFGQEANLLYKEDSSYKGYSLDTPLHISTRFNHTEISKFLISSEADTEIANAYGELPLHFAAANNNLEITSLLLANGNDVNYQAISSTTYFYYGIASKLIYTAAAVQTLMQLIGEIVFFKVVHDEIFRQFHTIYSGTPLYYAVNGIEAEKAINHNHTTETAPYKHYNKELKLDFIKYLVEKGADPDLSFKYYVNPDNQVVSYALDIKAIAILYSAIKTGSLSSLLAIPALLLSQYLFSFEALELKPIDIVSEQLKTMNGEDPQALNLINVYSYLKQYTTFNKHVDIQAMSYFNTDYIRYKTGLLSDKDIIHMNEYGMYAGGSGADQFIIHPNYVGKKEGWKLIIKDFNYHEDMLDVTLFDFIASIEDLHFEQIVIINKDSVAITTSDSEEIVTLYDFSLNEIHNINFILSVTDAIV